MAPARDPAREILAAEVGRFAAHERKSRRIGFILYPCNEMCLFT
jgi:hypothetical protein